MGRDDNKAIPGLQGATAPARAFHDFMIKAVANRPVENFDTQVKPPDWQQEPDDEAWYADPGNGAAPAAPPPQQQQQFVDPDGNPLPGGGPADREDEPEPRAPPPERLDREFLDRAVNGDEPPRRPQRRPQGDLAPPVTVRRPSAPRGDPVESRPFPPQP
jgi:penicillin-binding protein 1A